MVCVSCHEAAISVFKFSHFSCQSVQQMRAMLELKRQVDAVWKFSWKGFEILATLLVVEMTVELTFLICKLGQMIHSIL